MIKKLAFEFELKKQEYLLLKKQNEKNIFFLKIKRSKFFQIKKLNF